MKLNDDAKKVLKSSKIVFWDFDGVIKDSALLKRDAYNKIFGEIDKKLQKLIVSEIDKLGGLSRYEIIPYLNLKFFNAKISKNELSNKCEVYSSHVIDSVIKCPYVRGVKRYLEQNFKKQNFVIVTNTPILEMQLILKRLDIDKYFSEVFGAPSNKTNAIREVLLKTKSEPNECVLVGDSRNDYHAAISNGIYFITRGSKTVDAASKFVLTDFENI